MIDQTTRAGILATIALHEMAATRRTPDGAHLGTVLGLRSRDGRAESSSHDASNPDRQDAAERARLGSSFKALTGRSLRDALPARRALRDSRVS